MFFKSLSLNHFGSFDHFKMTFNPGMNVIVGENGTGKTQLVGALLAALIGKPAIRVNTNGVGPSTVRVSINESGTVETLVLNVSIDHQGNPRIDHASSNGNDVTLVSPSARLLSMLASPDGPQLILRRNTDASAQASFDIDLVGKLLPEKLRQSSHWAYILEGRARSGMATSGARHTFNKLLAEYFIRKSTNKQLPLIVDDFIESLPNDLLDFSISLLEALSETAQVIVFAAGHRLPHAQITKRLERLSSRTTSLVYYNHFLEHQKPHLKPHVKTHWVRGTKFSKQESRTCEFKEVKGDNPLGSIKSVVDQYVVAFLNARAPQEGAIFWGIRDEDMVITGITLSDQECDELRRVVTDKLHRITPPLPPTRYQIELHQITDGARPMPSLYIVEVRVPSIRKTLLFATGSQEIYVKTDSGKKKLSALEIQYELLDRHGIDSAS